MKDSKLALTLGQNKRRSFSKNEEVSTSETQEI